jgi:hypothetical protein
VVAVVCDGLSLLALWQAEIPFLLKQHCQLHYTGKLAPILHWRCHLCVKVVHSRHSMEKQCMMTSLFRYALGQGPHQLLHLLNISWLCGCHVL